MDVLTTEEQQVEAIKKWWSENWVSIIGGALVGVGLILGYRTWVSTQDAKAAAASTVFEAMIASMEAGKNEEALNMAGKLVTDFGDSSYAAYASLASARVKLSEGDGDSAKVHLQWVLDNADSEALKTVAAIRLARLLLVQQDYDGVLGIVKSYPDLGSIGEELRGDALAGKGDSGNARLAYVKAIAESGAAQTRKEFIQMKLDRLGDG